jgi:hypothetical protein
MSHVPKNKSAMANVFTIPEGASGGKAQAKLFQWKRHHNEPDIR